MQDLVPQGEIFVSVCGMGDICMQTATRRTTYRKIIDEYQRQQHGRMETWYRILLVVPLSERHVGDLLVAVDRFVWRRLLPCWDGDDEEGDGEGHEDDC
jgi:hypothetical protein